MAIEFLYTVLKDLKAHLSWDDGEKLVDDAWLDTSGARAQLESQGLTLRWSSADRVAERKLRGYLVVYELDESMRVKSRLVRRGGSVLLAKRREDP
jgi:hypothetical protein